VAVPSNNLQNAYIVAVEEDAKRRLEELLFNHKLTPIDMTKNVDENTDNQNTDFSDNSQDLSLERALLRSPMPYMTQSGQMTNGHVEMSDINGYKDARKGQGKKGRRSGSNETPMIDNLLTERFSSDNSLNKYNDDSFDDVHSSIEFDPDKHREMAIDVPNNFKGTAKTPPRLPSSSQSSPRSTPVREHAQKNKAYANANGNDELERIRHHQEEIRKRNEREEQRQKEQEFLRASLRRSEKMKALQKERVRTQQAGFDNTAFSQEDDDSGGFEEGYVSGRHTQNSRDYMKKNIGE